MGRYGLFLSLFVYFTFQVSSVDALPKETIKSIRLHDINKTTLVVEFESGLIVELRDDSSRSEPESFGSKYLQLSLERSGAFEILEGLYLIHYKPEGFYIAIDMSPYVFPSADGKFKVLFDSKTRHIVPRETVICSMVIANVGKS